MACTFSRASKRCCKMVKGNNCWYESKQSEIVYESLIFLYFWRRNHCICTVWCCWCWICIFRVLFGNDFWFPIIDTVLKRRTVTAILTTFVHCCDRLASVICQMQSEHRTIPMNTSGKICRWRKVISITSHLLFVFPNNPDESKSMKHLWKW